MSYAISERNQNLTPVSQELRKNATKGDILLWYNFLRKYPVQFRRQYVIGNDIVDFFCHKAKLVVELDGSQHVMKSEAENDQKRTAHLESQGLTVLRFSDLEVLRQFRHVCERIAAEVKLKVSAALPTAYE